MGCQVISMAHFAQTHSGGKALLYKGYKYLKIPKDPCWKGVNKVPSTYSIISSGGVPAHLYM